MKVKLKKHIFCML